MAKYRNVYRNQGLRFQGNSIHKDELAFINGDLSEGRHPMTAYQRGLRLRLSRPAGLSMTDGPFKSPAWDTIKEHLKIRDIEEHVFLSAIGRIATAIEVPDHWHLEQASTDQAAEHFRVDQLDLLQRAAEDQQEASAA